MNKDIFVVIEHLQNQVSEITYVMLAAARELAATTGGNVVGVLLGYNAQNLAIDLLADSILNIDHPSLAEFTSDAYQNTLTEIIKEKEPRAVLMGNTSVGSDVVGALSIRLDLPLVSSCHHFDNGKYVSQICGGKIMVEGELPEPIALITVLPGGYKPDDGKSAHPPEVIELASPQLEDLKVNLLNYQEPEVGDVDISNEELLLAVGRGIQQEDNIELVEELAEAMGGTLCASRPVVDLGWLPTSRMVGKSGKSVKPKLYLAIGISGAPEHVEGITGSETIVAINTDPTAPIFDIADYGIELDLFDFVEVLTEFIEEA
jgi:electron transfer flavoprotein alpha subunit